MSHRVCRFAALMLSPFLVATVARAQNGDKTQAQHFVCHTGFTLAQCQSRMRILRRVLNRYHADELGEWSWVLVRTTDWEELLSVRGFDARTPAFREKDEFKARALEDRFRARTPLACGSAKHRQFQ